MRKGKNQRRPNKDNKINGLINSLRVGPISGMKSRGHTKHGNGIKLTIDNQCSNEHGLIEAIFSSVPGLLYLYTEDGNLIGWNKQHEEMTGYNSSELYNSRSEDWFDPEDLPLMTTEWQKVFSEGKTEVELDLIRKDRKKVPFFFTGVRVEINGKPHLVGIGIDISEKRERRAALQRSEEIFKKAEEIARLGSWKLSIDLNQILLSNELYRILGVPVGHPMTYNSFLEIVHPDDRNMVDTTWKRALRKGSFDMEHRLVVNGELRWVHQKAYFEFDNDEEVKEGTGVVYDITSRKESEEERERALTEINRLKMMLEAENVYLKKTIDNLQRDQDSVIGESDAMRYVLYRAQQVAQTSSTVLLLGETGTGKGVIARFIHRTGSRRDKPLITVNCAGLPRELIESELFGREKGAYTGAQTMQIGRFELANEGTIFLDEIAELPVDLQVKLLKVIEEGTFERLGSPHTVRVDVQIIAATNRDLRQEIANGTFREDLFWRLNVFPITIPPLREHKQDIPLLAGFFLEKFNCRFGRQVTTIPEEEMRALRNHDWPGNVRELMGVIERSIITSQGNTLKLLDQIVSLHPAAPQERSKEPALAHVEKDHILRSLNKVGWKIEGPDGAAKLLGLKPSTLRNRMKKLEIVRPHS